VTPPNAVGYANGIAQSIVSLARCVGPVIGGYVRFSSFFFCIPYTEIVFLALGRECPRWTIRVLLRLRCLCRGVRPHSSTKLLDPLEVFFFWPYTTAILAHPIMHRYQGAMMSSLYNHGQWNTPSCYFCFGSLLRRSGASCHFMIW
jgi:hypothetical protein